MESIFVILTLLALIALIVIPIYVNVRANNSLIDVKCFWCGKKFQMKEKEVNRAKKYGQRLYCCGKCQREDEASEGVKEKRYRIFNE